LHQGQTGETTLLCPTKKKEKALLLNAKIKNKDCKIIIEPVNIYISEYVHQKGMK
jgi:hypothetical protein